MQKRLPVDPLRSDFRNFLYVVWKHLQLPDPSAVQYEIAEYLQHGPKRGIIQAFRGVGKSWITSAYVCWLLYCDPQLNILVVSASKLRADEFSTFTLRLIMEMEILAHLVPRDDQRCSKISFDVRPAHADHAPSVKSVGITGQLAGSRADVIVADDIEIPNNSATQTMRDKLAELVKEFDAILKPGGRILYLGTPQTEQSLYCELERRGYQACIWPARYPDKAMVVKYGERLASTVATAADRDPSLVGHSTWPSRFPDTDLMEREASYGRSGFALQFMLDTSLSDADRYPLKLSDLIVMDVDPERAPVTLAWGTSPELALGDLPNVGFNGDRYYRPMMIPRGDVQGEWKAYDGIVMAVDPSGRGGDETGYAVVAMLHSRLFVLDAGGLRGGYDDSVLRTLAIIAKRHRVNKIVVEPNFGDGMFNKLLAPVINRVHPVTIEDTERSSAQKERRIIDTLEPIMNQHRLVVDRQLVERDYKSVDHLPADTARNYRLFHQLTRITRDRGSLAKDDRVDALALAVHYWTELMDRDADRAAQEHRDALFRAELERYMDHVIGRVPAPAALIERRL